MKLVRDKPAEPFRRFYLFSSRLRAPRSVSLFFTSISLRYPFSPIRLDLLHLLTPFSFLLATFPFLADPEGNDTFSSMAASVFHTPLHPSHAKWCLCHSTIDLSVSPQHSFFLWNLPRHFRSQVNPVEISFSLLVFHRSLRAGLSPLFYICIYVLYIHIHMYIYVHIYIHIYVTKKHICSTPSDSEQISKSKSSMSVFNLNFLFILIRC